MKKAELETPDPMPESPEEVASNPEPVVPVEPKPLSPEELEELQTRAAKAADTWERLVRTTADFENFKKRAARERQDAARYANESLVQKLIPVLDNFDMALGAAQANAGNSLEALQAGIAMIQQQFKSALADAGVIEVDATGQPFDPHQHEAVSQQESAEVPEGHVLQQLRKGYKLRERLLRPATVIVARKPAAPVAA
jgi:molecular chaperone GrpE